MMIVISSSSTLILYLDNDHVHRATPRSQRVHCSQPTGKRTGCRCSVGVRRLTVAVAEEAEAAGEGALIVDEDVRVVGEDVPTVGEGVPTVGEDVPIVDEGAPTVDGDVRGSHAQALGFATLPRISPRRNRPLKIVILISAKIVVTSRTRQKWMLWRPGVDETKKATAGGVLSDQEEKVGEQNIEGICSLPRLARSGEAWQSEGSN